MTYRVDVLLTDGRHRSLVIVAPSPEQAVERVRGLCIARAAIVAVKDVRRWTRSAA